MPSHRTPTAKELATSREPRVAEANRIRQEQYLNLLDQAKRVLGNADAYSLTTIEQLQRVGQARLNTLIQSCGGEIVSRRRAVNRQSNSRCLVFLDECGSHFLRDPSTYRAFILSAVIVDVPRYDVFNDLWRDFKFQELGSADAIVHEPDLRKRRGHFENDSNRKREAMRKVIGKMDFCTIAVVVNRDDYIAEFGAGPIDSSIPAHLYWAALDFLMERLVLTLDAKFGGASAKVLVEKRGAAEDAELQYEYARVLLDGTSYIRAGFFRQCLMPGVEFHDKHAHVSGPEVADVLARPVGDKVLNRRRNPFLWKEFCAHACLHMETRNSILGLKIMPWKSQYKDIWKS